MSETIDKIVHIHPADIKKKKKELNSKKEGLETAQSNYNQLLEFKKNNKNKDKKKLKKGMFMVGGRACVLLLMKKMKNAKKKEKKEKKEKKKRVKKNGRLGLRLREAKSDLIKKTQEVTTLENEILEDLEKFGRNYSTDRVCLPSDISFLGEVKERTGFEVKARIPDHFERSVQERLIQAARRAKISWETYRDDVGRASMRALEERMEERTSLPPWNSNRIYTEDNHWAYNTH